MVIKTNENGENHNSEFDLFRETYLRYMGYANEVGESFRPLVSSNLVSATYGMAIGYVISDAYDKARKAHHHGANSREVIIKTGDVLSWQLMASVVVPGYTINRITWLSKTILTTTKQKKFLVRTIPTILGLVSIPFIIQPIDNLVNELMDRTYRKWLF